MDPIKIVGTLEVDFSDRDGHRVEGTSFFYTQEPASGSRVSGLRAGKLFLSAKYRRGLDYIPAVGDEVTYLCDTYGKPCFFQRV